MNAPAEPAVPTVPVTDPEAITAFLRNLHDEGEVFEVRAPDYSDHPEGKYPSTVSGFFDDPETAAREVVKFAARGTCPAWFVILNPCKRELLALAANRLKPKAKGTTTDKDVEARTHLLVDLDPVRKAGISSTASELAQAEKVAGDVRAFLDARGWPEPIQTMSGNGAGLIYPTHLPAEDGGLVAGFLNALASKFDSDAGATGPRVKIDTSCFNPARPTKLIGTVAAKGDSLPDRPHRTSRLVGVPEAPGIVTREMIVAIVTGIEAEHRAAPAANKDTANTANTAGAAPAANANGNGNRFEQFVPTVNGVESYLRGRGVEVKSVRGDHIHLARCPVVPDCESTGPTDIAVMVGKDGTVAYKNQHDRGAGLRWEDLRDALEPGFKEWKNGYKTGSGRASGGADHSKAAEGEPVDSPVPPAADPRDTLPRPPAIPDAVTFKQLRANHPALRAAVIEGLLRVGETANVIAASKVGKTWFTYAVALCVATGRPLLGVFPCTPARVLLIDNELHPENIAHRIPKVAEAMGVMSHEYEERLEVLSLRGKLADLHRLRAFLDRYEPGYFGLVVIDAWYRALPADTDENANGEVAALYNLLDAMADRMGCAVVCVHHASKGNQSGKAVTDVGSGAGSQSRAVDSHIVIRPHEEEGAFVMDAAVRSWAPIKPVGLRFDWPLWYVDGDLDPSLLKPERPRRQTSKLKDEIEQAAKVVWTPALFAETFVGEKPKTAAEIFCDAKAPEHNISGRFAQDLLVAARARGLVYRIDGHKKEPDQFTTRKPALFAEAPPEKAAKRPRRGK